MVAMLLIGLLIVSVGAGGLWLLVKRHAREKRRARRKAIHSKRWDTVFERTDLRKGAV